MSATGLDVLRGLTQPDQRSCGPASVVAARMLLEPGYRPASFGTDVVDLHRRLTAASAFGRVQLPWPRALGTPPWAVARAMSSLTGRGYRTHLVRWGGRPVAFERLRREVAAGAPCPLYVGSAWLPRHVVLAVAVTADGLQVYNPGRGSVDVLTRASWDTGRLTVFGRWDRPWFAVLPRL